MIGAKARCDFKSWRLPFSKEDLSTTTITSKSDIKSTVSHTTTLICHLWRTQHCYDGISSCIRQIGKLEIHSWNMYRESFSSFILQARKVKKNKEDEFYFLFFSFTFITLEWSVLCYWMRERSEKLFLVTRKGVAFNYSKIWCSFFIYNGELHCYYSNESMNRMLAYNID